MPKRSIHTLQRLNRLNQPNHANEQFGSLDKFFVGFFFSFSVCLGPSWSQIQDGVTNHKTKASARIVFFLYKHW